MKIHPLVGVDQSAGNSSTSGESARALMEGMQGAVIALSPLARSMHDISQQCR